MQGDEVPEGVVGALCLRDLPVGVRLARVDDVRELDRVLDEEDRDVVSDQVEDALAGVELRGEPAGVTDGVGGAAGAEDRGEAHEHRCLDVLGEEGRLGDTGRRAIAAEDTVGAGAAGVHHPLRDALVVEVHHLLAQMVVLEEDRTPGPRLEGMVRVRQAAALGVGETAAALGHAGLVGAGGLAGRRDGVRAGLVGLGGRRITGLDRLGDRRRLGSRLAGDALLRAADRAPQGVRRSLQGILLAHRFRSFADHGAGPAWRRAVGRTIRPGHAGKGSPGRVPRSPGRGVRNRESEDFRPG